ncbi:unnamed protein product [Eruca vesicaria subsp. sativa]|uniref:Uncharacterized protein n=1 Tax=Eruca vesicaria subsp. sativa TaxID=29727 RepID=A0ABC8M8A9_ERUVS|nr:unnamed protein product [Eruca vesicaria subsp. sativa]
MSSIHEVLQLQTIKRYIILLFRQSQKGEEEVGKAMLDKLGWRQNPARADRCWKNIKCSLHRVNVATLDTYVTSYTTTRATINCHRDDFNVRCATCFYYQKITKFVFDF